MKFALSPNLVFRGLLPNLMQWQGPSGNGVIAPPAVTGNNYLFTATQLLIKNAETNRYYVLEVAWPPGQEELRYEVEVVTPTPAGAIPDDGVNFEFSADGYLRFKHESLTTFHDLQTWNGFQTAVGAGVAANPGTFAQFGTNYRIIGNNLQFLDAANGNYYTLWLVGQHGAQQTDLQ
jgi:hypothetical protein